MIRLKSVFAQPQAADALDHHAAGVLVLEVADDLAQSEHAHAQRHEVEPVGDLRQVEGEARRAGLDVGADQAQQQAQHDHGERLEQRARGQRHRGHQAQHHQREILGRAELERHVGKRRREQRQDHGRHRAGEERAQGGGRQGLAGPALLGHLIAVDRGHHRGAFARQVDQDRGGRAAVLGAVIDAREHDQGRDRRQREGQRQEHGDGGQRPQAGQHADRGAEQAADEGVEQVPGLSAVAKPRPRCSSSSMVGPPYWAGAVAARRCGGGRRRAATSSRRSARGRSAASGRPSPLMNRPEQNRAMPSASGGEAFRLA